MNQTKDYSGASVDFLSKLPTDLARIVTFSCLSNDPAKLTQALEVVSIAVIVRMDKQDKVVATATDFFQDLKNKATVSVLDSVLGTFPAPAKNNPEKK